MKPIVPFAIAALLLMIPAGAAEPQTVGDGTIAAGSPLTNVISDGNGITSFYLDVSDFGGLAISSITEDRSGLGYDIDFYFWDASGAYIDGCYGFGAEETACEIPAGAAEVEVTAFSGVDLHVTVVAE